MTMLLTHKPEVAEVAEVAEVKTRKRVTTKPRRKYDKKARHTRCVAVMRTMLNMSPEEQKSITIDMLKNRLKLPFLNQVKKDQVAAENIPADLNVIVKELGGLVKVGSERPAGASGRSRIVYSFDPSTLTRKGVEIHTEIKEEENRAAVAAEAKRKAAEAKAASKASGKK
ncbi:hypothetical protein ACTG16_22680 [Aeromonas sp. 23P]|uniref:hypothetical protein n=1 Tax=Aeromonas sp. 23P TaxID=3452716 RepID=UPI003F7931AD